MRHIVAPLTWSTVFPKVPVVGGPLKALQYRLRQLDRAETLCLCAHLNLFISSAYNPLHSLAQQLPLLRKLLTMRDLRRIVGYAYTPNARDLTDVLFHREQLLELMYFAALYCPDSARYSAPTQNNKSRRIFLESALSRTGRRLTASECFSISEHATNQQHEGDQHFLYPGVNLGLRAHTSRPPLVVKSHCLR
jgi:hypothetical protein